MNFSQRKIRFLSRLLLVAGLFAQGTLAAHACVMSAEVAVNLRAQHDPVAGLMPCHESESTNVNACLMHCTKGSQANADQQTVAAMPVTESVLQVSIPQAQSRPMIAAISTVPLNTGPPLSIRYCSFLI